MESREKFAEAFSKQAEIFRGIHATDALAGSRVVNEVAASTARLLWRALESGAISADVTGNIVPPDPGRMGDETPTLMWTIVWRGVCQRLCEMHPEELENPSVLRPSRPDIRNPDFSFIEFTELPEDWQVRAYRYSNVCQFLAQTARPSVKQPAEHLLTSQHRASDGIPSIEPQPEVWPQVIVRIDPPQVVLDGVAYALTANQAVYLKELIRSPGEWLTDPEFRERIHDVGENARPDRWRNALPTAIRDRIETNRRSGSRWRKAVT